MSVSPRQTRSNSSRSPRKRSLSIERKSSAAAAKRRIIRSCSDTTEKEGARSVEENSVSTDARNPPSTSQHTESNDENEIEMQFMGMNIEETSGSDERRKRRLSKQRSRSANRVQNETQQEREARLAAMRRRTSHIRENETAEEKEARLAAIKRRTSHIRENETAEEREARLAAVRRRTSHIRENETAEEKEARLAAIKRRTSHIRENETAEEKEARLAAMKRRTSHIRENETAEQHDTRLANNRRRASQRRQNETPEDKQARLTDKARGASQSREKESPEKMKARQRSDSRRHAKRLELETDEVNKGEVPGGGYQPSTVIQGKVFIGMGPLDPSNPSNKRKYAQLYVMDTEQEELETELRLQNMCLPKSTTSQELAELRSLLHELLRELRASNRYVREYRMAYEMLTSDACPTVKLVIDPEKRPEGAHERMYNNPNADKGFKEITVLMDDANPGNHDIVVEVRRDQEVKEIDDTHRSVDALHFVLLFPTGANSWQLNMPQKEGGQAPPNLTGLEYYAYHLHERYSEEEQLVHPLLRSGRLFQEFCCVSFAKVENQRLKWANYNQKTLRAEAYEQLADDYQQQQRQGEEGPLRSGTLKILPASIVGSRRNMQRHFQDATAIVREYHKPDIFLTRGRSQMTSSVGGGGGPSLAMTHL